MRISPIKPKARGEPLTILGLAWIDQQKEIKIPEIERRSRGRGIPTAGGQTEFTEGGATRR
jgi:hypothetical protein